ncbi:hypothetical protein PGT21_006248 [Puccinia graminis f. sp. tritici]|uniref:Uncharacterized protein n=1 Tax=Puccinia graminis f. sp. tritici TaxID=56615 RepID=A0A5B0NPM5_PUCGR|nr:hypothetical protein PGT21_006248 [Puccinia graminis f. sp. tritici]
MVTLNPDIRSRFQRKPTSASAGGYPPSEWAARQLALPGHWAEATPSGGTPPGERLQTSLLGAVPPSKRLQASLLGGPPPGKLVFKPAPIALPNQRIRTENAAIPTTKSNLTLDDLIVRLRHYSPNTRKEALQGLQELLDAHRTIWRLNLGTVIHSCACLISDENLHF